MQLNWLEVERQYVVWFYWRRANKLAERCADFVFAKKGITYERYMVLLNVALADKPIKIVSLAQILRRSTNAVSTIIDRMVKDGLVKKD